MTTQTESDVAFVIAQLKRQEPWLSALGYGQASLEHDESKLLAPFFTVAYRHERAQRELRFTYGRLVSEPSRESLGLSIGGPGNACFSLDDYLTYKRASEEAKKSLSFSSLEGPREERIAALLSAWRALLEEELRDVVVGNTWIEVPFDWGDYK